MQEVSDRHGCGLHGFRKEGRDERSHPQHWQYFEKQNRRGFCDEEKKERRWESYMRLSLEDMSAALRLQCSCMEDVEIEQQLIGRIGSVILNVCVSFFRLETPCLRDPMFLIYRFRKWRVFSC
jgi:hypothetical protein